MDEILRNSYICVVVAFCSSEWLCFVSVIFSMRDHAVLYMRFCSRVYLAHVTTIL